MTLSPVSAASSFGGFVAALFIFLPWIMALGILIGVALIVWGITR